MSVFILFLLSVAYLVIGQVFLLSCDLELRTVCRRIWANSWLYVFASVVWPLTCLWIRAKWLRKQKNAGSI